MKKIILLLCIAITFSCTDQKANQQKAEKLIAMQAKMDSLQQVMEKALVAKKSQISTFLTFQKQDAEEAMNFYVGLFKNSKIIDVQRYGKDGPAKEGTIFFAQFELNGSQFACSDSYIKHEWDFTPGVSVWVACESDEEILNLFEKLSEGGKVLMPLNNYGFSKKFAFVEDRFGVSWQLNLE
jgi:predicted 3-demethylubiquinone-9 3-methyltransferase (glyoxalase superfamily)